MSNEKHIQNALHNWRLHMNHSLIVPNATLPSGEVDLLSITKSGFTFEHEIKISRADFKADFKHKKEKHIWMQEAKKLNGESSKLRQKFQRYSINRILHCANYFIYVVPENLISVEEIPAYAGLCYWIPNTHGYEHLWKFGQIKVVKNPPRLHKKKIAQERMEKLARSMMYRY